MEMDLFEHWGEVVSILALIMGFIIAIVIDDLVSLYVVIFLAGVIAGRLYWEEEVVQPLAPIFFTIIGFLVGYVLGAFGSNRLIVIASFLIGFTGSNYAHRKGMIKM